MHHALVIGIDRYDQARDLSGAGQDADAVGTALQSADFTLYQGRVHHDVSRAEMLVLFQNFSAELPAGATAFVYLAGHGVAEGGNSYLVPTDDGGLRSRVDLADHGVALRALTARLAARDVTALVLVDACRANALEGVPGAGGAADLVVGPGAMHLIYAAAPGQIAADGDRQGGPFGRAVAEAVAAQPANVADFFQAVRVGTAQRTQGGQRPWMITSGSSTLGWP